MNSSVSGIKNCFGCGVCAMVCKKNLIDLTMNADGFLEPKVNTRSCVNCGLCREVCSFINKSDNFNQLESAYGAWSIDEKVLASCSSGGVAYEIGKYLISQKFKICAVRYIPEMNIAEHYISESIEDLEESKGSKYIQSYTVDAFRQIDLNDKYLIIGTPCQISSIRRVLKKFNKEGNFILMDFFCHGVPSKLVWDKYLSSVAKSAGEILKVGWRNKTYGWHDSWNLRIVGSNQAIESRWTKGDKFYTLFLSDTCLNKACYDSCRFKYTQSYADIRIGDAWGKLYSENERGVSIALAFTPAGDAVLRECGCHLEAKSIDELAEVQMKKCPSRPELYSKVMRKVRKDKSSIEDLYRIIWWSKNYKKYRSRIGRVIDLFFNSPRKQ